MLPRLHYISQEPHLNLIEEVCSAGCRLIQLRAKNLTAQEHLQLAIKAKEITEKFGAKLIINDSPEIAFAVRAYGVHLGKEDMDPREARKIVGQNCLIGGSTNSIEDIVHLTNYGVDYVGLGPYKLTSTKTNLNPVLGTESISKIISQAKKFNIRIPIIAIGGIELENVSELRAAGVYGIAISGSISKSGDKKSLIQNLNNLIE